MRLDAAICELAATQYSCVAVWQLRDLGADSKEITRLRRSSGWQEVSQRVLIRTGSPSTEEQQACAAVLEAGPLAGLGSVSGSALWGLGSSYRLLPAHIITDENAKSFPGVIGHIYARVGIPDHWMTTYRGIRVARPELCIYQLCGHENPLRAERALDMGLSMGLVTIPSMRACLQEIRRRGRNGTTVLDGFLEERPLDYVGPATGLERRFIEVIGGEWRRQVESGGELWGGRVDFRHLVQPVIIEVQSERYHGALSYRRDDEARRARLESAGFIVEESGIASCGTRPRKPAPSCVLRWRESCGQPRSHFRVPEKRQSSPNRSTSKVTPRPSHCGQRWVNDSSRPSPMRLRVISTRPSSEMSNTCVRVLSRASASRNTRIT